MIPTAGQLEVNGTMSTKPQWAIMKIGAIIPASRPQAKPGSAKPTPRFPELQQS